VSGKREGRDGSGGGVLEMKVEGVQQSFQDSDKRPDWDNR